MIKANSLKTFIESGGDGTSKSSIGNMTKTLDEKSGEPRLKSYSHVECTLIYAEEEGNLLLILARSRGDGKLQVGKTLTYDYVRNIEYEDNDSSNLFFDVDSSVGVCKVKIDEHNFITDSLKP